MTVGQRLGRWAMIALGLGIIAVTASVNAITDRLDRRPPAL